LPALTAAVAWEDCELYTGWCFMIFRGRIRPLAIEQPLPYILAMSTYFYPKLQAVAALEPYRLRTTWSTGEVLGVDVGAAHA